MVRVESASTADVQRNFGLPPFELPLWVLPEYREGLRSAYHKLQWIDDEVKKFGGPNAGIVGAKVLCGDSNQPFIISYVELSKKPPNTISRKYTIDLHAYNPVHERWERTFSGAHPDMVTKVIGYSDPDTWTCLDRCRIIKTNN